jgi:tetratricopeptide (TPR) repeat protein
VIAQATDQGAVLANEYMEYQKKKMADANIVLMFGHLLLEMGEYSKAEKYFDTILASNPNDEEIACIYFNFGRAYRMKGDFDRATDYYRRAYDLHDKARPTRFASAAKALNGLGVTLSEQGDQEKAIECFEKALKLLHKSVQPNHIDVAGTLINLSSIYCERQEVRE